MMSLNQKLQKIINALNSVDGLYVRHYKRPRKEEAPFCVWQESDEGDSLHTNNKKTEQIINGTIDYFTQQELDPQIDNIQAALDNIQTCAWRLESVQYEDDTDLIHYEWYFEVA